MTRRKQARPNRAHLEDDFLQGSLEIFPLKTFVDDTSKFQVGFWFFLKVVIWWVIDRINSKEKSSVLVRRDFHREDSSSKIRDKGLRSQTHLPVTTFSI